MDAPGKETLWDPIGGFWGSSIFSFSMNSFFASTNIVQAELNTSDVRHYPIVVQLRYDHAQRSQVELFGQAPLPIKSEIRITGSKQILDRGETALNSEETTWRAGMDQRARLMLLHGSCHQNIDVSSSVLLISIHLHVHQAKQLSSKALQFEWRWLAMVAR